jgi:hypothetical protein
MAKVLNRAIKLGGETQTIGTPTVKVLEYDADSDVMRATGATVPTDGDRGYALGCLFIQTDGGTETVLYVNEGSATSADFNPVLGGVKKTEDLTATNTLTAADSGKVLFLNDDTEFATTLPAPAAGLNFKFSVKAAPSGADYTIVTDSGDDIIIGGINELETDDTEDGPYDDDADTITFEASTAVVGDWVEVVSDGTSWYLTGQANADGAITLSTT